LRGRFGISPWDVALFFDVCVTKLEGCSLLCRQKGDIACRHRLRGNAKVLNTTHYIEFLRFQDSQIILHCFYLASHNGFLRALAKKGRFIIVTRDHKFLKSAQAEWESHKKRKRRQWPDLVFSGNSVSADGLTIKVHILKNAKARLAGHNERVSIIEDINEMLAGLSK
jgi:hypothetical protein